MRIKKSVRKIQFTKDSTINGVVIDTLNTIKSTRILKQKLLETTTILQIIILHKQR